jgi:ABC-type nickel/cobalt efflux system permease component RcnA
MPGHAKTVVAAYLISQRGTYWHAVMLAVIVTLTHTALVVLMGLIIWAYQSSHPQIGQRLQLWLGIVSGILVAGMGAVLIWRALSGRLEHHHHDHEHDPHHDERSWWRKLFSHSHPHVPGRDHGHGHHHDHHGHAHRHEDGQAGAHAHGHDHDHDHVHAHTHEHGHDHATLHTHDHAPGHSHSHDDEHTHAHAHPHEHAHDRAQHHEHEHVHVHPHDHEHGAAHKHARHVPDDQPLTVRMLLVLGITGGIVPCPTATIIMLLGIGANVVLGALYAVAVFSLGLALTLMLIGFAALTSRRFASRLMTDASHGDELTGRGRWLLLRAVPTLSGLAVITLGALITANYISYMTRGTALIGWMG